MPSEKLFSFGENAYSSNDKPIASAPFNYINGEFVKADSQQDVINPATAKPIGVCPKSGAQDANKAIEAAKVAFKPWSEEVARTRAKALRKWSELMVKHQADLAAILSRESGKPITEAKWEIDFSAQYVEWYSGEAERVYGDFIPDPRPGVRTTVIKRPVGVVGIITPWNFPSAMITRAAAGAIAAGCSTVIKPAARTPFSALALCQLAEEAGIPKGVINVVIGDSKAIGTALADSFAVRKLSFTGSTSVGKELMKQCADTVKKLSMELGGNAPFIVYEDADMEKAVKGVMESKFMNCGQTCICSNRIFVHEKVHDQFVQQAVKQCKELKVGEGLNDESIKAGALIDEEALKNVEEMVTKAKSEGAKVETGGKRMEREGYFYEPTVLTGCTNSMDIARNEIFGPVMPIIKFSDADDVVAMANDTKAGLAAYFFTEDYKKQWDVSTRLQFGIVGINDGSVASPVAPFGGVKESGLGRDGSKYGIEPFLDIKYVLHSNL